MRYSSFVAVVFGGVGLAAGGVEVRSDPAVANTDTSWDTVKFRDDFGSAEATMPDPGKWIVNHPGYWWWVQGRTHFPNPDPHPESGWPGWVPTGEFPRVDKGSLVIEHHLFNPYDLATQNTTFLGGEVHTVQEFPRGQPYRFEARVRLDQNPNYVRDPKPPYVPYANGLVTSFFTYGYDDSNRNSDEIDFEFLSNQMNVRFSRFTLLHTA